MRRCLLFLNIPDTQMKVLLDLDLPVGDGFGGVGTGEGTKNGDEVSFPARLADSGMAAWFERVQYKQFIKFFFWHGSSLRQHAGRLPGFGLHD
jgi:hypothetical protein